MEDWNSETYARPYQRLLKCQEPLHWITQDTKKGRLDLS